MKIIKIRNTMLRTVAGGVILIPVIAVIIAVMATLSYGMGRLIEPFHMKFDPVFFGDGYTFMQTLVMGFAGLLSLLAVAMLLGGFYLGSRWAGERLFNSFAR